MIPILYEKTETAFVSNGIARLRDCISCIVTEERNGIYECDFEYPVNGANYDLIQVGRIVGVTHDESGDIQPFDIVSYTKPIDGVVTFHAVHISYRLSYMTIRSTSAKNSLADAFTQIKTYAQPSCPFTFWTNKTSSGYCAALQIVPYTVRQVLGGVEGSILDSYGGEYEWDKWTVKLWSARGQMRDFSIRYGVNMLDYNEEYDSSECYSSCRPYWTDGTNTVVGDKQTSTLRPPSGRDQCIPLNISEKFEDKPTKAQVESTGLSVMNSANPTLPSQTIEVSFVRLQDMGEYAAYQNLLQCKLCDTINVIFPDFNASGNFKIVKTEWNVLTGKYESMELGDLSVSLSEALGITHETEQTINSFTNLTIENNLNVGGVMTMEGHNTPPGFYETKSDTINKATGTSFASISGSAYTPAAGRWLITASARYSGASSGNRGVCIYEAGSVITSTQVIVPAIQSSSWATDLKTVGYVTTDGTKEYRIGLLQNTGGSLSTSYHIAFIRIR